MKTWRVSVDSDVFRSGLYGCYETREAAEARCLSIAQAEIQAWGEVGTKATLCEERWPTDTKYVVRQGQKALGIYRIF